MNKCKWSILLVVILMLSCVLPCKALAETAKPYMATSTGEKEKTGDSYIYVKDNYNDSRSIVQKKNKNGKEIILLTEYFDRELDENEYWSINNRDSFAEVGGLIHKRIITNGDNIFFAMRSHSNPGNAIIYNFNIVTGEKKEVKVVKRFETLSGYYNGNLYYCVLKEEDPSIVYDCAFYKIYKYNLKTKKSKWLYTGAGTNETSSYGRYMSVGGTAGAAFGQNMEYWIFDLKTGKKKKLSAYLVQCAKDGVYYTCYSGDYMAVKSPYKLHIKKSSYSLKKTKTIRTWIVGPLGKPGERYWISEFGRTFYTYRDLQKDKTKTVRYKN